MARKDNDETEETEQMVDETVESKPELSVREKIAEELASRQAADVKAKADMEKRTAETDALANLDIDDDVEGMVNEIKSIDVDIASVKGAVAAEIEPLNKQIAEIKAKPEYNVEEKNTARVASYAELVAKIGETPAKLLVGGAKAVGSGTGTGKGKGRNSDGTSKKEIALKAVCDEGLSLQDAVERYPELGTADSVRKNLWKPFNDGEIVKVDANHYTRA